MQGNEALDSNLHSYTHKPDTHSPNSYSGDDNSESNCSDSRSNLSNPAIFDSSKTQKRNRIMRMAFGTKIIGPYAKTHDCDMESNNISDVRQNIHGNDVSHSKTYDNTKDNMDIKHEVITNTDHDKLEGISNFPLPDNMDSNGYGGLKDSTQDSSHFVNHSSKDTHNNVISHPTSNLSTSSTEQSSIESKSAQSVCFSEKSTYNADTHCLSTQDCISDARNLKSSSVSSTNSIDNADIAHNNSHKNIYPHVENNKSKYSISDNGKELSSMSGRLDSCSMHNANSYKRSIKSSVSTTDYNISKMVQMESIPDMPTTIEVSIENKRFSINIERLSIPCRKKILCVFNKKSYGIGEILSMFVNSLKDQAIAEHELLHIINDIQHTEHK